jgi:hypothetical protein
MLNVPNKYEEYNVKILHEVATRLMEGDFPNEKSRAVWQFCKAFFEVLDAPRPALSFTSEKSLKSSYNPRFGFLTFPLEVTIEELLIGLTHYVAHMGAVIDQQDIKNMLEDAKKRRITVEMITAALKNDQRAKAVISLFLNSLKLKFKIDGDPWIIAERQKFEIIKYIKNYPKNKKGLKFVEACLKETLTWQNPFQVVTLAEWLGNGRRK